MATILFLTHKIPDPTHSDVVSVYYFIKELRSHGHMVYLFSVSPSQKHGNYLLNDLLNYCDEIKVITGDYSLSKRVLYIFHPKFILRHFKLKYPPVLLDLYYNPRVEEELNKFVKDKNIDVIFATRQMAIYTLGFNSISKVIQPYDAVSEWHRQVSEVSAKITLKILYKITTYLTRIYEKIIYPRFDKILVVTTIDKKILKQLTPELNTFVLPNGVDINYFNPSNFKNKDKCSLVFVSNMSGEPTVSNVLWFYRSVFQKIKKEFPKVKLYLVGKDPAPEIQALRKDPNVIGTGTVKDVRPYISSASVVVIPMIAGTGIKNKTLEALAMGKAVVSTHIGIQGINGENLKHFIVADSPKHFSDAVIYLLHNPKIRKKLGYFARKLIIQKYSWHEIGKKINKIIH